MTKHERIKRRALACIHLEMVTDVEIAQVSDAVRPAWAYEPEHFNYVRITTPSDVTPGTCSEFQAIAASIFQPALKKALDEYRAQLKAMIVEDAP